MLDLAIPVRENWRPQREIIREFDACARIPHEAKIASSTLDRLRAVDRAWSVKLSSRPHTLTQSSWETFRVLALTLKTNPRIAARDTLLWIDHWVERGETQAIDDFLGRLQALRLGWNVARSHSVDVIVAALAATRPLKVRLENRDELISCTLGRMRFRVGAKAARSTVKRLS